MRSLLASGVPMFPSWRDVVKSSSPSTPVHSPYLTILVDDDNGRMDVHENVENNTVTASLELPGLKPEEVNIDVNQDRLTISGESSTDQERNERGYTVRERSSGKFSRTLMLPQGTKVSVEEFLTTLSSSNNRVQHEDVRAKMENGVLNVTFPKAQQAQQPKRITVE